jgi:O-antigen/teichoic acid export membrane protein
MHTAKLNRFAAKRALYYLNQRIFFRLGHFFFFFVVLKRAFLGNLLLLQTLNWLIKPVWIFFIEVAVQNNLGDALYGKYYGIFGLALLFNILLDFGLNNFTASKVASTPGNVVPSGLLGLRMWLALSYVLITAVFGLFQNMDIRFLGLVILNQVLAGFTLYFRAILQGRHLFKTDSIVSVADRLVAVALLSWLIAGSGLSGEEGLCYFLLAQTAGYAVSLFFSWFYSRKQGYSDTKIPQTEGFSLLSSMRWFAILSLCMAVFTRLDTQMLRYLAPGGEAEVGQYARSFRFLDAALIFSSLISSQLLPLFSRMISRNEPTDGLLWLNVRIVLYVALPLLFTGLFFASPLLGLFYAGQGKAGFSLADATVFGNLMACFLPMALVHVFGTWLTAAGELKKLGLLALVCVFVNAGLNMWLIPLHSATGAAVSGLITQLLFVLICIYWVIQQKGFALNAYRLFYLILAGNAAHAIFSVISKNISDLNGFLLACGVWAFTGMFLFVSELSKWLKRGS